MDFLDQLDAMTLAARDNTNFDCPNCGHTYDGTESETAQQVVSFWGEDVHDFSCDHCGTDFLVRETVIRFFVAAMTLDELDE